MSNFVIVKNRPPYLVWASIGATVLSVILFLHVTSQRDADELAHAVKYYDSSEVYNSSIASGERTFAVLLLMAGVGGLVAWAIMKVTSRTATELTSRVTTSVERSASRPAQAAPVAPLMGDPADQLAKLAELRDRGVISDEEFQVKKTDILGRM
ncbi:SHOCT domain-containing protein [Pedococcus bigeumensis]|uniref:SHOCT domain-containing protein n=1 Tax=Pedococcus bigeumensis TaxID=433644 RepID=UPI002FE7FEA6